MKPAFGSMWIVSQLNRYPREVVKKKKEKTKKIEQKKNSKKKSKKLKLKKEQKELVFSSLGQNMRLLSLPYS